MKTTQVTCKQSSANHASSTKPTTTITPIDDILCVINGDDNEKSVEALTKPKVSHFYSINKFIDLIKGIITDAKFIQIYFDEVHDNKTFKPDRKSKYVRVLMCCMNGKNATAIDWTQLHETIPGFKYLTLSRAHGAIDGKLNKVLINIERQTSSAGFPYHNTLINNTPVNQALHEKMIARYNEHFNITDDEDLADVDVDI